MKEFQKEQITALYLNLTTNRTVFMPDRRPRKLNPGFTDSPNWAHHTPLWKELVLCSMFAVPTSGNCQEQFSPFSPWYPTAESTLVMTPYLWS